jgi:hypothetical protein
MTASLPATGACRLLSIRQNRSVTVLVFMTHGSISPLERVRRLCLALPETEERLSHGDPTFFVRGKKAFVSYADNHHGDGRLALWCNAPPEVQAARVETDPRRFFVPPYVGVRGWIGVRLDIDPDWDEIAEIIEDAYRMAVAKRSATRMDRR